jgi:FeS assembly SUF system regulator
VIRIRKLTDYGIVLLAYFVGDGEPPVRTARELSAKAHLPYATVSKILKALVRKSLLVSHRGIKGGYSLARSPEEISVAEIVAALEGPLALTECSALAPSLCDLEPVCPVRSNWRKINDVVRGALAQLSLAEMSRPRAMHAARSRVTASKAATYLILLGNES